MNTIIAGEKFQSLADLSIGRTADVHQCSNITFKNIAELRLNTHFDNPPIVFCFGHCIDELSQCINSFSNPFILLSHNSDFVLTDCESTRNILECKYVKLWFAQNIEDITFFSLKLRFLPTGIANQGVGNPSLFQNIHLFYQKKKDIYFLPKTYLEGIRICKLVPFLSYLPPQENIDRLAEYKFSICPDIDCHGLWESYLVRVVPITLNTPFMQMVYNQTHLPMVLLDSWDQLDLSKILPLYSHFNFSQGSNYLFMGAYTKQIIDSK
jgi:hypothetical protein